MPQRPIPLLEISDLRTWLPTSDGILTAVDGISLEVAKGSTLGIVGESGSGKSMLAKSILRVLPRRTMTPTGEVRFLGRDLVRASARELSLVRGREIGMVLQDPMTSLNPVMRIGRLLMELLQVKLDLDAKTARRRAVEVLEHVRVPDAPRRLDAYPHELSGGLRQRVSIAAAIACDPLMLIADEPTTALDVTVQRDVLDLLGRIQRANDMGMILITHDFGVVAGRTEHLAVMYAGKIVEAGPTRRLFVHPRHPYTAALLDAAPQLERPIHSRLNAIPGTPPMLVNAPQGCRFAARCVFAEPRCALTEPSWQTDAAGHGFACFRPLSERRPAPYANTTA